MQHVEMKTVQSHSVNFHCTMSRERQFRMKMMTAMTMVVVVMGQPKFRVGSDTREMTYKNEIYHDESCKY